MERFKEITAANAPGQPPLAMLDSWTPGCLCSTLLDTRLGCSLPAFMLPRPTPHERSAFPTGRDRVRPAAPTGRIDGTPSVRRIECSTGLGPNVEGLLLQSMPDAQ